jgi:hypothetical protein
MMEWHWVPRATEIFEACDEDPKLSLMLSTEFLLEVRSIKRNPKWMT